MNTRVKLVFSLPDMLINEIYEYDSTYHNKYNTNNFKKELENMYMKIRSKQCKNKVIDYLLSTIDDECIWYNEDGYIGDDESYNLKQKWYTIASFKKSYRFDGYFCHKYNDSNNLLDLYNKNPDNITGPGWVGSVEEGYYYDPFLRWVRE